MCEGMITRLGRVRRTISLLQEMGFEVSSLSGKPSTEYQFAHQYILPEMATSAVSRFYRLGLKTIRKVIPFFSSKLAVTRWINHYNIELLKSNTEWDIIIVEHIDFLPLACELKKKHPRTKIYFDIRDFYPREFEKYFSFRFYEAAYRHAVFSKLLKKCDAVVTVSYGLVKALEENYQIESELIRSLPGYVAASISKTSPQQIKMVHHGSANADRYLGKMISLFKELDQRFTLDFYLVGSLEDIDQLKKQAIDNPAIRFHDAVPFQELIGVLNQYDIGLFFWEPTTFNIEYSLPNKLFEFIQARLMIITTPLPDISKVIKTHNCGLVLSSFDTGISVAEIEKLTVEQIDAYKRNVDAAAKILCFEEEKKKMSAIMQDLLCDIENQ
jgi:hypothetical protein